MDQWRKEGKILAEEVRIDPKITPNEAWKCKNVFFKVKQKSKSLASWNHVERLWRITSQLVTIWGKGIREGEVYKDCAASKKPVNV